MWLCVHMCVHVYRCFAIKTVHPLRSQHIWAYFCVETYSCCTRTHVLIFSLLQTQAFGWRTCMLMLIAMCLANSPLLSFSSRDLGYVGQQHIQPSSLLLLQLRVVNESKQKLLENLWRIRQLFLYLPLLCTDGVVHKADMCLGPWET